MNGIDIAQQDKPSPVHSVKIILIVVAVIALVMAYMVYYVDTQLSAIPKPSSMPSGPISGSLSTSSYGVLTYNSSTQLVAYVNAYYSRSGASTGYTKLALYKSNPILPVYLVNVQGYCVQCFLPTTLLNDLNRTMAQEGVLFNSTTLNYIDINKISAVPRGAIVIIPSGLMPNILLPNVTYTEGCQRYSNTTVLSLLSEGDTVIYVGRNLSRSVSCTQQIVQNSNATVSALGIPIINSTYYNSSAPNPLYFKSPTFFVSPGQSFGTATSGYILNGTFISLSNYPQVGWNGNATQLAYDLATIIESRYWIPKLMSGSKTLYFNSTSGGGEYTLFTLNSTLPYSPKASSAINSSYGLLTLMLYNQNTSQEFESGFRYVMHQNGDISMPSVVGQSQQVQISAQVFNSTHNNAAIVYVPVYYSNLSAAPQPPVRVGQAGTSALYSYASFQLRSGYYIARLDGQQGNTYSSALFQVANAAITPLQMNFANSTFVFTASSNGAPISGTPYTASVNGAYNRSGVIEAGELTYSLPKGAALGHSSGTFYINVLGDRYAIPYNNKSSGPTIPPIYIEFAIAAVFVIILNRILVPTNVEQYFVDVPDIKPAQHETAKETTATILGVFDRVNTLYRWQYMPLTAEEVRAGISNNIKYGNTRISITLRNTYAVLNILMKKGLVVYAGDYYAPKSWTEQSGHGIDYLAVYRRLRDYCIANAMMFAEMGSSEKYDLVITSKGSQSFIKIYSSQSKVKDVEVGSKSRTFLVFLDEESRMDFLDRLYGSYGRNAELLKLAIGYGNLKLIDTSDLDELKL